MANAWDQRHNLGTGSIFLIARVIFNQGRVHPEKLVLLPNRVTFHRLRNSQGVAKDGLELHHNPEQDM